MSETKPMTDERLRELWNQATRFVPSGKLVRELITEIDRLRTALSAAERERDEAAKKATGLQVLNEHWVTKAADALARAEKAEAGKAAYLDGLRKLEHSYGKSCPVCKYLGPSHIHASYCWLGKLLSSPSPGSDLLAELERVRGIVDRLGKSGDGFPLVDLDPVFLVVGDGVVKGRYTLLGTYTQCEGFDGFPCVIDDDGKKIGEVQDCFSTRAAAEAAQGGEK